MSFLDKLSKSMQKSNSLLCVGLDPDPAKFPEVIGDNPDAIFDFNKAIIDATADLVCCYKPNSAFYESYGAESLMQLQKTVEYIKDTYPDIPVVLDAKRGDIGNTNEHYTRYAFGYVGADAVTVHPYQGNKAVSPYFTDMDKGVFILAKTSNPDSAEFQDIDVNGRPLYMRVIESFLAMYGDKSNCFFVTGATYPKELAEIRKLVGDAPLLVPGMGAQGGSAEEMVPVGLNSNGTGLIINSSRAVLYASNGPDYAEAARAEAMRTRDEINRYR